MYQGTRCALNVRHVDVIAKGRRGLLSLGRGAGRAAFWLTACRRPAGCGPAADDQRVRAGPSLCRGRSCGRRPARAGAGRRQARASLLARPGLRLVADGLVGGRGRGGCRGQGLLDLFRGRQHGAFTQEPLATARRGPWPGGSADHASPTQHTNLISLPAQRTPPASALRIFSGISASPGY